VVCRLNRSSRDDGDLTSAQEREHHQREGDEQQHVHDLARAVHSKHTNQPRHDRRTRCRIDASTNKVTGRVYWCQLDTQRVQRLPLQATGWSGRHPHGHRQTRRTELAGPVERIVGRLPFGGPGQSPRTPQVQQDLRATILPRAESRSIGDHARPSFRNAVHPLPVDWTESSGGCHG
jgi:hypothetical protein